MKVVIKTYKEKENEYDYKNDGFYHKARKEKVLVNIEILITKYILVDFLDVFTLELYIGDNASVELNIDGQLGYGYSKECIVSKLVNDDKITLSLLKENDGSYTLISIDD